MRFKCDFKKLTCANAWSTPALFRMPIIMWVWYSLYRTYICVRLMMVVWQSYFGYTAGAARSMWWRWWRNARPVGRPNTGRGFPGWPRVGWWTACWPGISRMRFDTARRPFCHRNTYLWPRKHTKSINNIRDIYIYFNTLIHKSLYNIGVWTLQFKCLK